MDTHLDRERLPYAEPLLREHGSLRDLTGKTGEKGKEKEGDKSQIKDCVDKGDLKDIQDTHCGKLGA
jgi:hypothetical protein